MARFKTVKIRIVQHALLFCDLFLQLRDRLWQRFQRMLFVEIKPPL